MSDKYGHFAWKLWPEARKACWQCGKEPLKVADVGEHRTHYPSHRTEFLCQDCVRENLEKAIRETQGGLQRCR